MSTEVFPDGLDQGQAGGSQQAHEDHAGHASTGFYWTIGVILTVITAVEVAIFYIPALESVLVPTLLLLSAAKFVLVVMFFMHQLQLMQERLVLDTYAYSENRLLRFLKSQPT